MKIGFIGLGIMGSRMAANLQKHGHPLVVFNRTPAKAKPLLGACGTLADSPAKELYRLAMRQGHATEDFSAVYEYLASDSNSASRFALSATDFPFGTEQN